MTPLDRIESASSRRRVSSTWTRGWNSFGVSRSMSTSMDAAPGGAGASGMSALSPLPRAGRFSIRDPVVFCGFSVNSPTAPRVSRGRGGAALQEFPGERDIGFGAAGFAVVENHRHAVAGRFAESDIPRDDGTEHLLFEELTHFVGDLLSKVRAI